MNIKSEIITEFRNFVQLNATIHEAENILKKNRNILIGDFNIRDSRCIWMSLLLYKFKQEMDVSDELWTLCRQLIISLLKSEQNLKTIITKYLNAFNVWQDDDLKDVVTQIGSNYYNLIQIKNSIEKTENIDTIEHWLPHYQNLILKIRSYCKSMGIIDKLDNFVFAFEQQKYDIVKEIMDKAYWDKIEEDMNMNNLDMIYSNLSELKTLLHDIVPQSNNIDYINEYFDIEYIKHIVANGVFDKEYLFKLFIFVIDILKKWDSIAFSEKYDKEMKQLELLDGSLNHIIRCVIQKLMILSVDLKNRKALWNIILKK